jgi:hypothetical protein
MPPRNFSTLPEARTPRAVREHRRRLAQSPLPREREMRMTQPVLGGPWLQGRGHNRLDRFKAKGLQEDRQPPLASASHHGGFLHPRDEDDGQERVASSDRSDPHRSLRHGDVERRDQPTYQSDPARHAVATADTRIRTRRAGAPAPLARSDRRRSGACGDGEHQT